MFQAVKDAIKQNATKAAAVAGVGGTVLLADIQQAAAQTEPTAFTVDWTDLTGAVFTQGSLAITAGLVLGGAILAFKFSWKMIKRMAS